MKRLERPAEADRVRARLRRALELRAADANPDKCAISILVGKEYDFSDEGTSFKVDDLSFNSITSISSYPKLKPTFYPNPTGDQLSVNLKLQKAGMIYIDVLSLEGKSLKYLETVGHTGMNKIEMSVKDLAHGVYFIRVWNGEESYSE